MVYFMYVKNLLILFIFYSSLTFAWNSSNSPEIFSKDLVYQFDELFLEAELDGNNKMWPGYYWPHNKGSIANRWSGDGNSAAHKLLSREALIQTSQVDLNSLSPSEKLDILNGDYSYTETKNALKLSNINASDWNGICHGFAAASLNLEEKPFYTATNKDGIELSLFTSDIKALSSFYYAKNQSVGVKQIGRRCFFSSSTPLLWRYKACSDTDAAAFHIILANYIGIKKKGFVADLDRFKEVWNYPIFSYKSEIISRSKNRVHLKTSLFHIPIVYPHYGPLLGTSFDEKKEFELEYVLNLNNQGRIISGFWKSYQRPDFIWVQEKLEFTNNFDILNQIYN